MYLSHQEAVDEAETIFLGTVVSVKANEAFKLDEDGRPPYGVYPYEYAFSVDECIKGECSEIVTRTGDAPMRPSLDNYQTGESIAEAEHLLSWFWTGRFGRIANWPDCKLHPTFGLGKQYLLFSQRELSLGQELITSDTDRWLAYVRRRSADNIAKAPFPIAMNKYFSSVHAVAVVDQTDPKTQLEMLKGEAGYFAFLSGPLEHPDFSGMGMCSPRDRAEEQWSPVIRKFLIIVEHEQIGERHVRIRCEKAITHITYSTSWLDKYRTLSDVGMSRFEIKDDMVLFSDGLFTVPIPAGLSKNAIGPKINKIAVDDLRQILESYQDKPEADK